VAKILSPAFSLLKSPAAEPSTGGISSGIAIKLVLFTLSPRKPLETRVVRNVLVDRIREIRKKLVEEVVEKMGEMGEMGEERCQSKRTAICRVRSPRQRIQGNVNHAKLPPGKRPINKLLRQIRTKSLILKS